MTLNPIQLTVSDIFDIPWCLSWGLLADWAMHYHAQVRALVELHQPIHHITSESSYAIKMDPLNHIENHLNQSSFDYMQSCYILCDLEKLPGIIQAKVWGDLPFAIEFGYHIATNSNFVPSLRCTVLVNFMFYGSETAHPPPSCSHRCQLNHSDMDKINI